MILGGNEYGEILVLTEDDELIAYITDEIVIYYDGYKVEFEPVEA